MVASIRRSLDVMLVAVKLSTFVGRLAAAQIAYDWNEQERLLPNRVNRKEGAK